MNRTVAVVAALAVLAACDRKAPAPQPSPAETATPKAETVSIIRPEVDGAPEPAPPMKPLKLQIGFEDGGTDLSAQALTALEQVLASEQMKAGGAIMLGGHSDSAGGDAANLSASRRRAEAVRDWLVDHGIAEDRITLVAFGEQNPAAPNALPDGTPDEAGRARNRRVELTVAVPEGTPPTAASRDSTTLVDELAGGT